MSYQIYSISQRSQLYFTRVQQRNNHYYNPSQMLPVNSNSLCLMNEMPNILKMMPKQFTINTKNSSGKFNTEFLIETCSTISSFIKEIPQDLIYHLDIDDPRNVLKKFEQLYEGQKVIFEEDDLPTCTEITDKLFLVCCPNYMKPEHLKCSERGYSYPLGNENHNLASGVEMSGLTQFIKKPDFECFTIITNKNKYKCNKFGIFLSDVIFEKLSKEPLLKQYAYDFDDENNEFLKICDLFNFNPVEITRDNMDSLKEMAEDLQIQCIIGEINKYINETEKVAQTIDDQQTIIDSIDELFDWIYNIRDITVISVRNSIVDSFWAETDENVQELVAFILEAVKTDILLHPYLVDLLIQLNEQANESNSLDILIPFIVDKLLRFLDPNQNGILSYNPINFSQKSPLVYSFIYRLYKKGIIQKDQLTNKLKKITFTDKYLNAWFLPLLVEMDKKNIDYILQSSKANIDPKTTNKNNINNNNNNNGFNDPYYNFIRSYLPDKIDLYEKMLDSGEPDDILTVSLRNDDVDTLQSIVSRSVNNFKSQFVPFNIYDEFMQQSLIIIGNSSKIRYLNYAAAFGSVKCFKYLILNHDSIDEKTFEFAVYGGNNEIIKIVEQNSSRVSPAKWGSSRMKNSSMYGNWSFNCNPLLNAINKHRNNIFDWIFEKDADSYKNSFYQLALTASNSGNAHALIEIIDRGFDISNNPDIIHNISLNGFYRLSLLLSTIDNQKNKIKKPPLVQAYNYGYISDNAPFQSSGNNANNPNIFSVYFGNLSIFKLYMKEFNFVDIEILICFAVENNYMSIINYFFNCLLDGEIKFQHNYLYSILSSSLKNKSDELFKYLLERFKEVNPSFNIELKFYLRILQNACKYNNFEGVKTITEIILNNQNEKDKKADFSQAFNSAASVGAIELCQYFIDKKVNIDYDKVLPQSKLNVDLFSFVMNRINPGLKPFFLRCIDQAIKDENKELIDYLFQQNAKSDQALYKAVCTHNVDIVDIVLKYNKKPFFVNQIFPGGTALLMAVLLEDTQIVKRLLSIPGINPALFNRSLKYPLITAIERYNIEIINAILDFYGDDIKFQKRQLEEAMKTVFDFYCSGIYKQNPDCLAVINRILDIKYIDPNYAFNNPFYEQDPNEEYDMNIQENDSEDEQNNDDNENDNDNENNIMHNGRNNAHRRKMISKQSNKCSFLLCACVNNDIEMVERLLKIETIDVNIFSNRTGDSPLIIAVRENYFEIAKLLIDFPLTNINHRNYKIQTALTIAAKNNSLNIINLLITNERFDPDESQFNYAFYIANNKISKQLISSDFLDINYQYSRISPNNLTTQIHLISYRNSSLTKLTKAARSSDVELIDLIINHPSFDKNKSQIDSAIRFSIENKNSEIFKKLLKLVDDDVNFCDLSGNSLLINAIHFSNGEIVSFILNDEKFDSKKSNILKAFVDVYAFLDVNRNNFDFIDISETINYDERDRYEEGDEIDIDEFELEEEEEEDDHENLNETDPIKLMEMLYEYDKNHENLIDLNKLLPNGESFFTIILFHINNIEKIVKFLLEKGADPNQPDINKVYPLEKAISLNSYEFAMTLLNSKKIDFSIRIPIKNFIPNSLFPVRVKDTKYWNENYYSTYLHIAAEGYNKQILLDFLENDYIDINTVDDFGNTALMNLCIYGSDKTFGCFDEFFRKENLDFLHKNKEGLDALALLKARQEQDQQQQQADDNEIITDKNEYLNKLKETAEMVFS